MTWPYKIGTIASLFFAAALSGFFYGRNFEQTAALKQAVKAYQNASEIQNEVNSYSDYALCLAIGGLHEQCQVFLSPVDKAAKDKRACFIGEK